MTKVQYQFEVNGRSRRVTVDRAAGVFKVDIDGVTRIVHAERIDAHTLSLLVEDAPMAGRTTSHEVALWTDAGGLLGVSHGGTTVAVSQGDRRRRGSRDRGPAAGSGSDRIVAPMPGKIVRVLVSPGDAVRARQAVVVVEAMKMENELRAAHDGTVRDVLVRDGQSVDAGSLLVVIGAHAG